MEITSTNGMLVCKNNHFKNQEIPKVTLVPCIYCTYGVFSLLYPCCCLGISQCFIENYQFVKIEGFCGNVSVLTRDGQFFWKNILLAEKGSFGSSTTICEFDMNSLYSFGQKSIFFKT